ncbi:hypothetical protein [Adhaeribacter pallidiroseus]|uniref:Uncharacterized protein n=1 Tax=Adhaeribacter pallidiroseus TaxID=2072847 RepID=A0A369QI94_9BACT|nr:hypothetical protein [Adhaeribacter pallidiroseus]RDC62018.1 hypothetical protein AHMF7616_00608 [Adhaeribacter pallidiroseus]
MATNKYEFSTLYFMLSAPEKPKLSATDISLAQEGLLGSANLWLWCRGTRHLDEGEKQA